MINPSRLRFFRLVNFFLIKSRTLYSLWVFSSRSKKNDSGVSLNNFRSTLSQELSTVSSRAFSSFARIYFFLVQYYQLQQWLGARYFLRILVSKDLDGHFRRKKRGKRSMSWVLKCGAACWWVGARTCDKKKSKKPGGASGEVKSETEKVKRSLKLRTQFRD